MKKILLITVFIFALMLQINAQNEVSQNSAKIENAGYCSAKKQFTKNCEAICRSIRSKIIMCVRRRNERFKRYLNKTVGTGLIGVGIGATFQQISNNPPEWEKNGKGFARRLGSNFGENAIQETVAYGIEETFKLDSKFYKSKKTRSGFAHQKRLAFRHYGANSERQKSF